MDKSSSVLRALEGCLDVLTPIRGDRVVFWEPIPDTHSKDLRQKIDHLALANAGRSIPRSRPFAELTQMGEVGMTFG